MEAEEEWGRDEGEEMEMADLMTHAHMDTELDRLHQVPPRPETDLRCRSIYVNPCTPSFHQERARQTGVSQYLVELPAALTRSTCKQPFL